MTSAEGTRRGIEVAVPSGGLLLPGELTVPPRALGVVVFAHGSGSSRHRPRNRAVAARLREAGLATLLFDLLSAAEEPDRARVFDIPLLGARLADALRWLGTRPEVAGLRVGCFGASTGAAAALWAAAEPDSTVAAVVSRGGRPDLAADRLPAVRAPVLLVVGGADHDVLALNRAAASRLHCAYDLQVVPGATHLFEEPGALDAVSDLAAAWFARHLSR
jgi:putative phosphoribosyl transferase